MLVDGCQSQAISGTTCFLLAGWKLSSCSCWPQTQLLTFFFRCYLLIGKESKEGNCWSSKLRHTSCKCVACQDLNWLWTAFPLLVPVRPEGMWLQKLSQEPRNHVSWIGLSHQCLLPWSKLSIKIWLKNTTAFPAHPWFVVPSYKNAVQFHFSIAVQLQSLFWSPNWSVAWMQ